MLGRWVPPPKLRKHPHAWHSEENIHQWAGNGRGNRCWAGYGAPRACGCRWLRGRARLLCRNSRASAPWSLDTDRGTKFLGSCRTPPDAGVQHRDGRSVRWLPCPLATYISCQRHHRMSPQRDGMEEEGGAVVAVVPTGFPSDTLGQLNSTQRLR